MSDEETVAPFKEVIEEIKQAGGEATRLCYQCGKCDVVCPWNKVSNFSMRKLIREASFGLTEIEQEDLWRCTTCGTCPDACPRGVGQIGIATSLRRIATNYEVFPAAVKSVRTAGGSLVTDGNPLSEDRGKRADWAAGLGVPAFEEGMEVLYFVGCYYAYDPRLKKVAVATTKLLQKAGVAFGTLGVEESCCGESIRRAGNEEAFRALAKRNIKAFIDQGVKRIVVSSPHCYHTFKNEYPEFMVNFEVVHMSQLLLELIDDGRLKLDGAYGRKITFHDPCYLGRHNGVYDAPRELMERAGADLVEMADRRQGSLCCGGGGGRIWMDTPLQERFSNLRVEQARATGAPVMVTACPYCISNFEESRLTLDCEDELEVKDITEILAEIL